ncbi:hypothetical protein DFJ74DRAFT_127034 [Hyaloraphidium curvatum]|nr:hypothetical protein DFJ74DRAFT_127034 [Hyaloraphidium curvatum]
MVPSPSYRSNSTPDPALPLLPAAPAPVSTLPSPSPFAAKSAQSFPLPSRVHGLMSSLRHSVAVVLHPSLTSVRSLMLHCHAQRGFVVRRRSEMAKAGFEARSRGRTRNAAPIYVRARAWTVARKTGNELPSELPSPTCTRIPLKRHLGGARSISEGDADGAAPFCARSSSLRGPKCRGCVEPLRSRFATCHGRHSTERWPSSQNSTSENDSRGSRPLRSRFWGTRTASVWR